MENKLTKVKLTTIAIVLFYLNCFSQDFRNGFIITNQNDTLHGYIDYMSPANSSIICAFKKDSLGETIKYTPADLAGYKIENDRYFVSKNIRIADSSATYFVEYLVEGMVNLYYLEYNNQDLFFIEKENVIYPLTNEQIQTNHDGRMMIKNSNKYIGVLNWLMMDAEDLSPMISKTKFNHLSLIQITKEYHNKVCKDFDCVVYYNRSGKLSNAKWKTDFGIALDYGVSVLNMKVIIDEPSSPIGPGYKSITDAVIVRADSSSSSDLSLKSGIFFFSPGIYLRFNRNNRLSLQLEVNYEKLNHSFVKIERLKLPVSLSFDLARYQSLIPYFSVGFGFDYYLQVNNTDLYLEYQDLVNVNTQGPVYETAIISFKDKDFLARRLSTSVLSLGVGFRFKIQENKNLVVSFKSYSSFFKTPIAFFISNEMQIHNFSLTTIYSF